MSDKKRKRGRPRLAPILSYGSEMKMRNNVTRTIKKPRYLQDPDEEDSISRGSTPARSIDNASLYSKSSTIGGKNRNYRGYNPEIDDKDSEYHYGSDFEGDDESDTEKNTAEIDLRSISEITSDVEDSEMDDVNIGEGPLEGDNLPINSEGSPSFVPFWKLGPAGTLGYRPHTPIPVWLQDRDYPPLELPQSSDDLLMPQPYVLQAVGIYEVLRHFRNIIRLSPFHFEDFCASLLTNEQNVLLSEIHMSLLKALVREEEGQQTHFGQLDQKDSINIRLYFADAMTWAETLRGYLQSDAEFKPTLEIMNACNYPFTSLTNRLMVLQFLCDQFLQTSAVREDLLSEGKIRYDDHCRVCHKTGDLLCCDSCPAVYHLDCADPPLSNAPLEIEDWTCSICNGHKIEGVTDCSSLMENSGLMCRQEPLGYDRHGRKYWFLVRRIIVESEEGDVWYYSTLEQLDLLLLLLDSVDLEEPLYAALKEFGDDIRRQMEVTERITEKSRSSKRAAITFETEETRKRIEKIQAEKLKLKKEGEEKVSKIIEEVRLNSLYHEEGAVKEESSVTTDVKKEEPWLPTPEPIKEEPVDSDPIKEELADPDPIKVEPANPDPEVDVKEEVMPPSPSELPPPNVKKECALTKVWDEAAIQASVDAKLDQLHTNADQLYRLGCDHRYRSYCNQYASNPLALNKLQHNEERDKRRHLSHKFSLTSNSEFKWNGQVYGTRENQMLTIRQTLMSLEQNLSSHFFHPNWQYVRKAWSHYLTAATTSQQFAKAMLWLVSCIKPVVFNTVWHEALGHIRLKRITALDREERKKQEKKEKKEAEDEARLFPFVKFTKGVKHQLWKMKGEEYRLHGLWGWQWSAAHRKVEHVPMDQVGLRAGPEKITIPIKSNGGLVRGLPISPVSFYQLAEKNPSLRFSLLSPRQQREQNPSEQVDKQKEVTLGPAAGRFEVSAIMLEEYFDEGVVNVSRELTSRLRLVYPKLCKGSSLLDSLLGRRMALKIQEERDLAKNKRPGGESVKDADSHIDIENDSDSTVSDTNHSEEENIEEIPDSQRRVMIHKQRPAGHLLKEMRQHKIKYEALDKSDETMPCYSALCRAGGRSSCYSSSCLLKERTKQKLINSVNNYKIITCKPAPFDNVGSASPIRLSDLEKEDTIEDSPVVTKGAPPHNTINGQVMVTPSPFALDAPPMTERALSTDLKLPFDEDSNSRGSTATPSDSKVLPKAERMFSAQDSSGRIYLKKSSLEGKKPKKHKIPPTHFFVIHHRPLKVEPKSDDGVEKKMAGRKSEAEALQATRSLFILPSWELRMLSRKGGKYSPAGFNQSAKITQHFWPYPCPRPVFRLMWLYRTTLVATINAAALQLRILWACLRWDDMHEKGPLDGRKQVTTDIEIIQTEILKRKVSGRFYEKTDYLRRKVTIPLDMPKPVREFTPSQRSGLRKRRRAQSPVNKVPESAEEWVEEERLELWEVRYFGERLEKATTLSRKADKDGAATLPTIGRCTSPAELKAKIEEQLKIQRAGFNQKKVVEAQAVGSGKGVVKVAIGSAGGAAKMAALAGAKLVPGPASSIVTVGGGKLPSVLSGRKIVTTKGGKIITVQTAGGVGGLAVSSESDASVGAKITLGKSSVFPVSSLPKVRVTPQGNKVIKLQNLNVGGQRAILPRVVPSGTTGTLIRPLVTTASVVSTTQGGLATSTPGSLAALRPTATGAQQIQILQLPDGQFQVKGLQQGQQLLQRTDGKLQLVNTKQAPGTGATLPATPIGVAPQQQAKTKVTSIAGSQILKVNGQQVILRASAPNGKQILGVNAKEAALAAPLLAGSLSASKFKMVKAAEGPPKASPNPTAASLLKEKQVNPLIPAEEKPKSVASLSPTPPASPTKGVLSSAPTSNTMTLRVQVRMTEQGPKTIIQGLQPGVGLTKDHIMAIQQQVRSMLAQYNLQVNQLSPLMTLTLHATNKNQSQPPQQNQGTAPTTNQNQALKMVQSEAPTSSLSPSSNVTASESKDPAALNDKMDPEGQKATDLLSMKEDPSSDMKENAQSKFVLTNDYIQQSIKSALSKDDLAPDVEEKLMQLQKYTTSKTRDTTPSPPEEVSPLGKGTKRAREQDENEWECETSPLSRAKVKKAKAEKPKVKRGEPLTAVPPPLNSKAQLQDARKKVARQQKLDALLAKHKDLLKKDILKKRALLEKELQLQIHKELSLARQQRQTLEKVKAPDPPPVSTKRSKHESGGSTTPISGPGVAAREVSKASRRGENASIATTGAKAGRGPGKTRKANKSKSKKIVCICRTTFDDTKFYVGCDLCGNWFHGDCVGITEALSRSMTEYVCDDCANAKLNKDLFCYCRQPYDETQFYICCEKCEDWYHGRCIGIMQGEADDIDDYICPKCEPDNPWNRPCQRKLVPKDYTELKKVAKGLVQHKNAWPFLEPVDQSEVPDYYKVVKVPMDLRVVEKKVAKHEYKNLQEFVGDVMLVFDNCRAYNPPNSSFCSCANTLELFFCLKLKQLKAKVSQKT